MVARVGTHNGTFHCDEALAVYMLRTMDKYKDATVIRTRDPAKLDECDIVVDVGAVYDHKKLRYDHHQKGFTETFDKAHQTKLSSAGLIYKHYGKQIIASRLGIKDTDSKIDILYPKVYDNFVEALDAIDNGISKYPTDIEAKYRESTNLSSRVAQLNPWWNKPIDSAGMDKLFLEASDLTGREFFQCVDYLGLAWLPARDLVLEAVKAKHQYDIDGHIVVFEQHTPWKEHLFQIEQELQSEGQILYVLYADETGGSWRVQAVPKGPESFESRLSLPEPWRGVRDEQLSNISGIPGCVFVHASGFIGGNKTRDGALEMAKKALTMR